MTVIVGIVDKKTNKIHVGADKGFFVGDEHFVSPEAKIIKKSVGKKNMIIGNAGDHRPFNLIKTWDTKRLKFDPDLMDTREFVTTKLVPEMKKLFEKNGYRSNTDFIFLIALNGELFEVYQDYAVVIPGERGSAIGGAAVPATGVLHFLYTHNIKLSPKKKVEAAIEASINTSNYAKGPIDILSV